MKVTFQLKLRERVKVSENIDLNGSVPVGQGVISWGVDSEQMLEEASISFNGMPLKWTNDGIIETAYPELQVEAYRFGLYFSNRVFFQTNVDAIDVQKMFNGTPSISPETPEEQAILKKHRRIISKSLRLSWSFVNNFEPSNYSDFFPYSEALADYCDALRVESLFLKFQQFYKVIEYFVPRTGEKFDRAVSNHAISYDPRFTQEEINNLRSLRNRCVHSKDRTNHISSEKIAGLAEVKQKIDLIRKLAQLFLKHPP